MIYPALQPTNNNRFVLLEEYRYRSVKIPVGYQTNGADIPRAFWIIVPPFKPKILPAVLVHDFIFQMETREYYETLKSTDWYVSRFVETGIEIPQYIKDRRLFARNEISLQKEKFSK